MKNLVDFPYEHILVLGLAKSGTAAAKVLLENDKAVRVNDMQASSDDSSIAMLRSLGAEIIIGSHPLSVLEGIDLIVKNPGIPYDNIILAEAIQRGIPIITEIELAGQLAEGTIIGITGSNGKTTTTTLTSEMLLASKQQVKIAGNIGVVATEIAQELQCDEVMVLELSSFQLLGIKKFRPKIAILLNIFEAHLDYHKSFANYLEAKSNIFKNQTEDDYLIYNADNPTVVEAVKSAKSIKLPFSVKQRFEMGVWVDDDSIYYKDEKIIDRSEIVLVGEHHLENILAAISAAILCGATIDGIRQVLTTFSGVKHRLQYVDLINNRLFYNDSKATNILATEKALSAFQQPTILLAGGLDRGNGFSELIPSLTNVKAMILFGETAEKLKQTGMDAGVQIIELVEDVEVAVKKAYSISEPGDIILLSPACASWDQYRTFEERGDMFINAVHTLK